jgi:hypothetical protein
MKHLKIDVYSDINTDPIHLGTHIVTGQDLTECHKLAEVYVDEAFGYEMKKGGWTSEEFFFAVG